MNRPFSFIPAVTVVMMVLGVVPGAQAYKKVKAVVPQAPRQVLEGVKQIACQKCGAQKISMALLADEQP